MKKTPFSAKPCRNTMGDNDYMTQLSYTDLIYKQWGEQQLSKSQLLPTHTLAEAAIPPLPQN
jgi:hypothetical protein